MLNWIVWNRTDYFFYKVDLALNNLQRLICRKTPTTNKSFKLWRGNFYLLIKTMILSDSLMNKSNKNFLIRYFTIDILKFCWWFFVFCFFNYIFYFHIFILIMNIFCSYHFSCFMTWDTVLFFWLWNHFFLILLMTQFVLILLMIRSALLFCWWQGPFSFCWWHGPFSFCWWHNSFSYFFVCFVALLFFYSLHSFYFCFFFFFFFFSF